MSILKVDTIKDTNGVEVYTAKAWVNFDGTFGTDPFTVANGGIRAAGNVSSVTDNGTGDYTVNFTTAMPDANYSAVFGAQYSTTSIAGLVSETTGTTRTTSSLQIRTANSAGATATDLPVVQISVFR